MGSMEVLGECEVGVSCATDELARNGHLLETQWDRRSGISLRECGRNMRCLDQIPIVVIKCHEDGR